MFGQTLPETPNGPRINEFASHIRIPKFNYQKAWLFYYMCRIPRQPSILPISVCQVKRMSALSVTKIISPNRPGDVAPLPRNLATDSPAASTNVQRKISRRVVIIPIPCPRYNPRERTNIQPCTRPHASLRSARRATRGATRRAPPVQHKSTAAGIARRSPSFTRSFTRSFIP